MEPNKAEALQGLKNLSRYSHQLEAELLIGGIKYHAMMHQVQHLQKAGLEVPYDLSKEIAVIMGRTMDSVPSLLTELIVRDERIKELETAMAELKPFTE